MKTTLYPIILLLTMSLCTLSTFSQFDPLTNSFGTFPAAIPSSAGQTDNPISYSAASGVNCTDTTFWAIAGANVDLFTLNGTGIKKSGTTTITGGFDGNLAFCNNLDGGAFSPTFYSTQLYHKPVYYNGTGVTATSTTSRYYLISAGGYGNYLYYISADTVSYKSRAIVMYNSAGLTTVYNLPPSVIITAAGLAVDNYGNVWFLTGHDNDAFIADTLNVVSPLGHMVRQYPFSYNTLNGYGCFLLNGVLYVGLGSKNSAHPNTVLPITITSTTAIAGTPIAMPVTTAYSDMASCTPGSPLAVNELPSPGSIIVFPNPVKDYLTIQNSTNESLKVIVYDVFSKELLHQSFNGYLSLNTEKLSRGTYLFKILNKAGTMKTGKFVKE
jgi:hypothetical protein